MQNLICKVLLSMLLVIVPFIGQTTEPDFFHNLEKEANLFYFGKGHTPYQHHENFFGKEKLMALISEVNEKTKTYFGLLGDHQAYACTHMNNFKEGVSAEMHRAMVVPLKNISSPDPLRWVMDRVTGHVTSPAGKPLLGSLYSYIYHFDESGKLTGYKEFENDEIGVSLGLSKTLVVKYCFDPPLVSQKCNTIEHYLVRLDANTEVLFSVLVDTNTRSEEAPVFKKEALRKNTNDSGSGFILLKKIGQNIVYVELSKFLSSQKNTVSEFKMFDKKISRDQCEKNSQLLSKRLGIEDIKWSEAL